MARRSADRPTSRRASAVAIAAEIHDVARLEPVRRIDVITIPKVPGETEDAPVFAPRSPQVLRKPIAGEQFQFVAQHVDGRIPVDEMRGGHDIWRLVGKPG